MALTALLLAGACGDDGAAGPPSPVDTVPAFHEEAAAVYAAVIRHVHEQEAGDAARIFVRSRVGGERGDEEAVTIPLGMQVELVDRLADVAPLDFVDNPEEVIEDDDAETGELRHHGVLLRLGHIDWVGDDRARVHVALYRTRDRAHEATYEAVRAGDEWVVAATDEPDGADGGATGA